MDADTERTGSEHLARQAIRGRVWIRAGYALRGVDVVAHRTEGPGGQCTDDISQFEGGYVQQCFGAVRKRCYWDSFRSGDASGRRSFPDQHPYFWEPGNADP